MSRRRYVVRWLSKSRRGVWFHFWRPSWEVNCVYVSIGLWFVAFYAGDPQDPRPLLPWDRGGELS